MIRQIKEAYEGSEDIDIAKHDLKSVGEKNIDSAVQKLYDLVADGDDYIDALLKVKKEFASQEIDENIDIDTDPYFHKELPADEDEETTRYRMKSFMNDYTPAYATEAVEDDFKMAQANDDTFDEDDGVDDMKIFIVSGLTPEQKEKLEGLCDLNEVSAEELSEMLETLEGDEIPDEDNEMDETGEGDFSEDYAKDNQYNPYDYENYESAIIGAYFQTLVEKKSVDFVKESFQNITFGKLSESFFNVMKVITEGKYFPNQLPVIVEAEYKKEHLVNDMLILKKEKWIQKADIKKGALHKRLGLDEDKTISKSILNKITKAEVGDTIKVGDKEIKVTAHDKKMANFAKNVNESYQRESVMPGYVEIEGFKYKYQNREDVAYWQSQKDLKGYGKLLKALDKFETVRNTKITNNVIHRKPFVDLVNEITRQNPPALQFDTRMLDMGDPSDSMNEWAKVDEIYPESIKFTQDGFEIVCPMLINHQFINAGESNDPVMYDKNFTAWTYVQSESYNESKKYQREEVVQRFGPQDVVDALTNSLGLELKKEKVSEKDMTEYGIDKEIGVEKYSADGIKVFIGPDPIQSWYAIFFEDEAGNKYVGNGSSKEEIETDVARYNEINNTIAPEGTEGEEGIPTPEGGEEVPPALGSDVTPPNEEVINSDVETEPEDSGVTDEEVEEEPEENTEETK